jgi:hypothetical protein
MVSNFKILNLCDSEITDMSMLTANFEEILSIDAIRTFSPGGLLKIKECNEYLLKKFPNQIFTPLKSGLKITLGIN